jgi:hypothetical protein
VNIERLKVGQVVQDGRTVLLVNAVYQHQISARVLLPVPKRIKFRSYTADEILRGGMKDVSDHMYDKAMAAYGGAIEGAFH